MSLRKSHIATIVVGGAIALSAGALMFNQASQNSISADIAVGNARLAIADQTVAVGQTVELPVVLSTGPDATSGVDLVMTYDPSVLELVDADPAVGGLQVKPGTLFDLIQMNAVDAKRGVIRFSAGQQPVGQPVVASNQPVATVIVKGLKVGQSAVKLHHTAGALNDTNVIKPNDGRDLLTGIQSASVRVTQ